MAEEALSCPKCARQVPPGAATCPHDGTPLNVGLGDGGIAPTFVAAKASAARKAQDWNDATATRPPDSPAPNVLVDADYTAETDRAIDSLIGAHLGDYVIKARLGSGGMGIVYEGEQPLIGKKVAIKILRPEIAADEKNVARLLAEARAVNAIRHRGIIDIFNFGKLPDGRNYIVMEYLAGEPLDAMMHRRGALPVLEVIDLLNEILSALAAGHGAGIIHRDLKPSNIHIVTEPNGQKYTKVLDFGLAKSGMLSAKPMTHTNVVVGTPEYMAPEQARAEPVSPQSDLYALGIIGFELLTGKLPFLANSPFEWMMHQVNTAPPKPSSIKSHVPPELDALILKMLAKKEADRPATADLVREELARIRKLVVEPDPMAVPMTGFRAAGGPTGPRSALTDDALANARAQRDAPRGNTGPRLAASKPPKPAGHTGPRPAYPANGQAPSPAKPAATDSEGDTLKGAPAAHRSDTIISAAVPAGVYNSPGNAASSSKVPIVAIALALIGVLAAGGGYYMYSQSLNVQPQPLPDTTPVLIQPQETAEVVTPPKKDETPVVDATTKAEDAKPDTVLVVANNNNADAKPAIKKDPVIRPTRRAVLQSELTSLVSKLQDSSNVKLEAGSIELVRTKLRAVKNQLADASSDKDFDVTEKALRDIRKQHFR